MKKFLTCERMSYLGYDFMRDVAANPVLHERIQDLVNPPDFAGRVNAAGVFSIGRASGWRARIKWDDGSVTEQDLPAFGMLTISGKANKAFKMWVWPDGGYYSAGSIMSVNGLSHIYAWDGLITKFVVRSGGRANIQFLRQNHTHVFEHLPDSIPNMPMSMDYFMFGSLFSKNAADAIAKWDVSNVTGMTYMFAVTSVTPTGLPIVLNLENWRPKSSVVGRARSMFYGNVQVNFDASDWCAWPNVPRDFAHGATNWTLPKPSICNNG